MEKSYSILKLHNSPHFYGEDTFREYCFLNGVNIPEELPDGFFEYEGKFFWVDNPIQKYSLFKRNITDLENVFEINFEGGKFLLYKNSKRYVIFRVERVALKRCRIKKNDKGRFSFNGRNYSLSKILKLINEKYGVNLKKF